MLSYMEPFSLGVPSALDTLMGWLILLVRSSCFVANLDEIKFPCAPESMRAVTGMFQEVS